MPLIGTMQAGQVDVGRIRTLKVVCLKEQTMTSTYVIAP